MPGIEPGAFHMQSERSTAELHPPLTIKLYSMTINSMKVFEKSLYPPIPHLYSDRSVASGSISPRDNTETSVMVAWPSGLRRWF